MYTIFIWPLQLIVLDQQQDDYLRQMEHAIRSGQSILLTNVHEKLEASLDPILRKELIRIGLFYSIFITYLNKDSHSK